MFVSLSEVSFLDSIQRDNCVTGAKAMSSSLDGSESFVALDLTN